MIGLKRNVVKLCEHSDDWDTYAKHLIIKIKESFADKAVDVQHVGSTAIKNIMAKPMIDIAIGVNSFDGLDDVFIDLEKHGIYKSTLQPVANTILCAVKSDKNSDICLAVPHIVLISSKEWNDLIVFRDYMNCFPNKAKEYEAIKMEMSKKYRGNRNAYCAGKQAFISEILIEARVFYKVK